MHSDNSSNAPNVASRWFRIFTSVLIVLLLAHAPAEACSKFGYVTSKAPREVHLLGTARPDTVVAGRGDVQYVVAGGASTVADVSLTYTDSLGRRPCV